MTLRSYDFIEGPETDELPNTGTIESSFTITKFGDYTITNDDNVGTIIISGGTVTLPVAADNKDRKIIIINSSSSSEVYINGNGADINYASSITLFNQFDKLQIQCDGTNWFIIGAIPLNLIQDFTLVKNVGDLNQKKAGHIYPIELLGIGSDIAYYKFGNGYMTDDEIGSHTLTAVGSPTNTNGILGDDYAVSLNGSSYYTTPTLLDTPSTFTNGIGISFWFKVDDGNTAVDQVLFRKDNIETGGSQAAMYCYILAGREMLFTTVVSGVYKAIQSRVKFIDGQNDWRHLAVNWDTTNGKRMWLDGILLAVDNTATTFMSSGTIRDFAIGASISGGSAAAYFAGDIALFQVQNIVYTQQDIDKLLSTRYEISANLKSSNAYNINAQTQKNSSTNYIQNLNAKVIHKEEDHFLLKGYQFCSDDKLKLEMEY